jgi:dienelactone hydrolase
VLAFSHGSGAVPTVYTRYTEHLASHGYIVVAPAHSGDTYTDVLTYVVTGGLSCNELPFRPCSDSGDVPALNRPQDISFVLDKLFDGTYGADLKTAANIQKVGALGQSFGGYTTLMLAGGLQTATGSFPAGALADPRIKAAVELSGLDENVSATNSGPSVVLPKPNIEAIHIPMIVMYGVLETNVVGHNFVMEGQDFFNRLNTAQTGIQYRIAVNQAVHNSFLNFCEQGWLDTIKLGNDNPSGIDFATLIGFFTLDLRIPSFPPFLFGKTDEGYQAVCRNDFLYEPSNRAIWDAVNLPPTLGSLLLNNPPFSIPLSELPGFIDPATSEFVPTTDSDKIQDLANGYLVSFFNSNLKLQPQYDRFIKGDSKAVVEECRQVDGKRKCKLH